MRHGCDIELPASMYKEAKQTFQQRLNGLEGTGASLSTCRPFISMEY